MFSVNVGPPTNFCFRARSGFAGKPNVKRERELIWHPHICQKWKGGHVGDRSTGRWESGGRPQIRIDRKRTIFYLKISGSSFSKMSINIGCAKKASVLSVQKHETEAKQ